MRLWPGEDKGAGLGQGSERPVYPLTGNPTPSFSASSPTTSQAVCGPSTCSCGESATRTRIDWGTVVESQANVWRRALYEKEETVSREELEEFEHSFPVVPGSTRA